MIYPTSLMGEQEKTGSDVSSLLKAAALFSGTFLAVLAVGDLVRGLPYFNRYLPNFGDLLNYLLALFGIYTITWILVTLIIALVWALLFPGAWETRIRSVRQWFYDLVFSDAKEPQRGALYLSTISAIPFSLYLEYRQLLYLIENFHDPGLIALSGAALTILVLLSGLLFLLILRRIFLLLSINPKIKAVIHARTSVGLVVLGAGALALFAVVKERAIFKSLDGWLYYCPLLGLAAATGATILFGDRVARWNLKAPIPILVSGLALVLAGIGFFYSASRSRISGFMVNYGRNIKQVMGLWTGLTDFDGDGYSFLFAQGDCAPFDSTIHPGAFDIPGDGIDQDCFDGDLPKPRRSPRIVLTHPYRLKHPNVLIFSIDACRRDVFGLYGEKLPVTPNFDRWAKQAQIFNDAISPASWTLPSFSAMWTGRYAAEIPGFFGNVGNARVPGNIRVLNQYFQKAGYDTFAITSGIRLKRFGLNRGLKKWTKVSLTPFGAFSVKVAQLASRFLDRRKEASRPFFLWLHMIDPHHPYRPPKADQKFGKKPKGLYLAEVHFVDRAFRIVTDALKRNHLEENTIVVVFADHGEAFWEHGRRYHSMSTYAEEIRIPFMWYIPGVPPARFKNLVGTIDLLPTLLDLAGIDPPRSAVFRGISLAPYLVTGQEPPKRAYLSEQTRYTQEFSLVTNDYQLRYDMSHNLFELYDRKKDPGEFNNIADMYPQVVLKLRRELVQRLLPVFEVTTGRVKRVLLKGIPEGFHRVEGEFLKGPYIRAIRRSCRGSVCTVEVVFKAKGPMKGKYFHVKVILRRENGNSVGERKEAAAHYYYVPSMWRKGDLVLHRTKIRLKGRIPKDLRVCVQFLVDGKALLTRSRDTELCYEGI